MAIGCKITATYTPYNGIEVYDPTDAYWVTSVDAWITAVWTGGLVAIGPNGFPPTAKIEYVNTSDSADEAIRVVLIWGSGVQTPFDLVAFQAQLAINASESASVAAIAAFDTSSSMLYHSTYVEQWSDETT